MSYVEPTTGTVVITGPADLDDQRWLDSQIGEAKNGFDAVILIAKNWTDGRNLSRLHPGMSAADYVRDRVGYLLGREAIEPLLIETNWSHRQIAAVTGVSPQTVGRKATVPNGTVAPRLGADGKTRKAPKPKQVTVPTTGTTAASPANVTKPSLQTRRLSALAGQPVAKLGKVEARDQVNLMRRSMVILRPETTVPQAQQQVIDLLPDLKAWIAIWEGVTLKP
jgi:hypothetical protein